MVGIVISLLTIMNAVWLCLGNASKKFSTDNILYGYIYNSAIDYDITHISDILDIRKYLIVKNKIKTLFWLIKKRFPCIIEF